MSGTEACSNVSVGENVSGHSIAVHPGQARWRGSEVQRSQADGRSIMEEDTDQTYAAGCVRFESIIIM